MRVNRFAAREIGGTVLIVAAIVLAVFGVLLLIDAGQWGTLTVLAALALGGAGWRLAAYDPTGPES